jgi:hypothetical protein
MSAHWLQAFLDDAKIRFYDARGTDRAEWRKVIRALENLIRRNVEPPRRDGIAAAT